MSAVAEAAVRVRPRHLSGFQEALPLVTAGDDLVRSGIQTVDQDMADLVQMSLDLPFEKRPRIVLVGLGRTPPKTTQSIIEKAVERGLRPGEDIIATRYHDLRVGKQRGFVRLAQGTGADGMVLAGQGQEALFLFRGGGNLKPRHLEKIGMIQSVDGATALTDLSFIERAGSKAITNTLLQEAGLPLARTIDVHGETAAIRAFDDIVGAFDSDTAVLKKVNSLGGKDVHFVQTHDDVRRIIASEPDADYVMQEFLPHAKDQDIRVHMVWNRDASDFEVANSYVRNRNPFALTPNLANGGYPTLYRLSPWEEHQALESARVLAQGSPNPPLHVGLDFFPRNTITASTVERNQALHDALAGGALTRREALEASHDTVVIGEAASSAGTKGTEIVLGEGVNPVTDRIVDGLIQARTHGVAPFGEDALDGALLLNRPGSRLSPGSRQV